MACKQAKASGNLEHSSEYALTSKAIANELRDHPL